VSGSQVLLRRGLDVAARGLDAVAPPEPGLTVLAYHQVGAPTAGSVNLTVEAFAEQMAMLAAGAGRCTVVTLDDGLAALDRQHGDPMVAVTFDDGTADFADHAVPVLARHGIPATLYLATAFVEEGRSFWDDGTVLSWRALRDACSTGLVSVGSHTHRHVLLDRASPAVVADELDRSRDLIEDRLGMDARHFAYPKALPPSPAAAALVRERFASAARAGGRVNPYGTTDPQQLARTPVTVRDEVGDVARKARGGLRLEGLVRERLDRRRYAGRTS